MLSKKITDRIINVDSTLQDALLKMDSLDCKLLLVFKDNRFRSVISIGDVQRAIIKGEKLTAPVSLALRSDIKTASTSDEKSDIILTMKKYRMEFMPVLGQDGELKNLIFWDEIISEDHTTRGNEINVPVVIMAGGKGTRLKPLTNIIPKPLIPIGEKPIIEWIIDSFNQVGVSKFWVSVNYKKELIQSYFNQLESKTYEINFFEEVNPLGTAGSLHLLKGRLKETFFVTNCDILVRDDYSEILNYHIENKNELTAVAVIKNVTIPYGTFTIGKSGVLTEINEKPNFNYFINGGMYILEPHLIDEIPENTFFHITELIQQLITDRRRVGVFPVSEGSWLDIGEWGEYNKTSQKMGFEGFQL